ncbi:BadF/BadG/BcrA/BcrD ATPase family protein [Clostridium sp.]|uniref:N-acetylglucosamine kinase n=1 Tax=Clostridium sp. TaxID=1506 RepID=UPI0025C29C0F|nr:BadF/BadG/BcrA/BcrD ATPase family protein [Clostridium sp.]
MYFLGIDGGGTKTCFTLINENGNVINRVIKGTCHPTQIGFNNLEKLLIEGLEEITNSSNISKKEITKSYLGLAGYGIVKEIAEGIAEVVSRAFDGMDYILNNDVRVAIAGALAGEDGINVVAGTGSIALALKDEKVLRCGGWGYSIGDEASAYWIGKKSLTLFSKQSDGRVEKASLYEIFKKELDLKTDFEIVSYVNDKLKGDRGEIAKLAKLCSDAAEKGDEGAIAIFDEAAKEIAEMIKTLLKNYNKDIVKVSYTGGVFRSGELILKPLREYLNGYNAELVEPKLSPDLGACLLAYMNSGKKVTEETIMEMKE